MIYTDAGTTKGTSCNNYVLAPPNVIIIKVAYDNEKSYEQNSSHRVNSTVTAAGADDADVHATKDLNAEEFLSHEQRTRDTESTGNSGCVIDVSVDMGSMQFAAGLEQMDQVSPLPSTVHYTKLFCTTLHCTVIHYTVQYYTTL